MKIHEMSTRYSRIMIKLSFCVTLYLYNVMPILFLRKIAKKKMAALQLTIICTIMSAPDHFIDIFTSNEKNKTMLL